MNITGTNSVESDVLQVWMKEAGNLRAALEEHALVAIANPQGRITYVNDQFCAISKHSREELIGQDHSIITADYHGPEFFQRLWDTVLSGKVWHGDIKNRAKDGTFFWVSTTIVPFFDDREKPRQFVAIGADLTEQKRVAAELANKLVLQQLLADLSTRFVGLQFEDIDVAIAEALRRVVTATGLDRSSLWQVREDGSGMILTHYWQREGWPSLPLGMNTRESLPWAFATLRRGEPFIFSSLEDLPPAAATDIETFRVNGPKSNVTFPLIARGRVVGAIAFATLGAERKWREEEITELKLIAQIIATVVGWKQAEMREEELRNELAHATRVSFLGELTATLAHELNQPLAAILSNAQAAHRFLANGVVEPGELRAILADIVRDNKRAGNVIHNLRAMVSKHPTVHETCGLNDLVWEVLELMRSEMIEAKIEVRPALAPDLPMVEAARVEMQ